MTIPNFTSLLTALRAFVLKSRPAYRDYLGTESVEEKTVLLTGTLSAAGESVTAADGFIGFTSGQTYKATIGEETVEVTAQYGTGSFSECIVIGSSNVAPSDAIPGWMVCVYNGNLLGFGTGDWAGKQIEVATSKMVPVEKWSVKKLAYELLPDRLLSALSAVANTARKALTAADAAQSTADAVQSTADAAQSTANAAQSILGDVSTGKEQAEILLTFDKQTSGRDSFVFNGFSYYKFSEFSPAPVDVIGFSGTIANGATSSEIVDGENCREYGLFIMVEKAGACTLPITSTVSGSFTAPSVGLYAKYQSGNDWQIAGTAKFTYLHADLLVMSPTGKKFKITVDDTGTLSATEVTNTTT